MTVSTPFVYRSMAMVTPPSRKGASIVRWSGLTRSDPVAILRSPLPLQRCPRAGRDAGARDGRRGALGARGHGFRMLDDTVFLEVKQGPYRGPDERLRF